MKRSIVVATFGWSPYPGSGASIRIEALDGDKIDSPRFRKRQIGQFLKELDLTEGR